MLFIGLITLTASSSIFADNIGFVDLEKVLTNYNKAQTYQTDLQKKREDYQKFFQERQKKLEEAKEKNKSEKDLKRMIGEMEEELKGKQEELFRFEAEFQRSILNEVTNASQKVAKEYGIDIVMDKRVIYSGGFDLTDFVVRRLNK